MRGGKRNNAGRKQLLSEWDRLSVGLQCEAAFRAEAEAKQKAAIERVISQSDYDAVIAKVHAIPVSKRAGWLQSEAFAQHCEDVKLECHLMAGTDMAGMDEDTPVPRIITALPQKPRGVRTKIIATVAEDWSKRIEKPISQSTVTRCWEEARSMIRFLAEKDRN